MVYGNYSDHSQDHQLKTSLIIEKYIYNKPITNSQTEHVKTFYIGGTDYSKVHHTNACFRIKLLRI